jgi:RHS repeat-associated protein
MSHPDYLGNNEFISDLNGDPYQYFWYSAFGEAVVSDHSLNGTYDSPWRFNGKEFDPETGNYYYGARYYDPMVSQWLSVDALAMHPTQVDKSPYAFTWNNPINLVDPDGNCPSCKTDEDWRIYQAQLDSYDLPLSAFGVDEGGNRIAYVDGKVIDIVRHNNRFDAFFAITPVDALLPNLVGSFTRIINSRNSLRKWLWGDDVAKAANKASDASGGTVLKRGDTNAGDPRVVVQKGDRTFDITESRVKEYVKNPRNPNAQYGDQVDFRKSGVPDGSERIIGAGKGHKRTPTASELDILFENQ